MTTPSSIITTPVPLPGATPPPGGPALPGPRTPAGSGTFVTTRWTRVLEARGDTPDAKRALGELCEVYWQPVFRFLRRAGHNDDTARDLAQEFFSRLLSGSGITGADPRKGRFRSFMLGAVKHFLADYHDRGRAIKRGGGHAVSVSLDEQGSPATECAPLGESIADPQAVVPDAVFDRQWALTIMERALNTLESEFRASGKADQFDILKPWLAGDIPTTSQASAGQKLGLSDAAIKVAIHRLRKDFRQRIRREVLETLEDPSQLDAELRYLVEVLTS